MGFSYGHAIVTAIKNLWRRTATKIKGVFTRKKP